MASDRGRLTYDKTRHYRSVVMQQGRVTLEADWNEAQDIVNEAIREETLDIVGPTGTSDDGYRIIKTGAPSSPAFDFSVGAGTLYVGGVRVSLDALLSYDQQREQEWLDHSSDPEWQDLPTQAVSEFVYLSLREQEVGAVEDSALREVALGGPDTAARTRLLQHIVRRSTDATDCATALGEAAGDWRSRGLRFDAQSMRLLSQATLEVRFQSQPVAPNPCEPDVQGGYLAADNQLIRVQISGVDTKNKRHNLVWGFDNASFLYRVDVIDAKTLRLRSRPVDTSHEPRKDQAVEVLRSAVQLGQGDYVASATGLVTTLTAPYDPDTQRIILDKPLPPEYLDTGATPQVFLRVWDEQVAFTPGTPVALGGTGLQVTVRSQDSGRFYIGDYWLFAVRPGTPTQVYPQRYLDPQPPDGPRLWACPLGLITWNGGALQVIDDCRKAFSPLTEAIPALHVTLPNWTNDDFFALDRLQTTGLSITLDGIPEQTSRSLSPATMIVTLEIPVVAASDAPDGPRLNASVILDGSITVEDSIIKWIPQTDLSALLGFFNVTKASRVRIVLKGHAIWGVQDGQTLYLDGQAFGTLGPDRPDPIDGTVTPRIDLDFPSGAGARASDFESWFYLGQVQPKAPTLVSVSLQLDEKNVNAVFAGQTVTGIVTLSHAVPIEVNITLESSSLNVAPVKPTKIVIKGQTQGSFEVETSADTLTTTDVVITASSDGVTRTAPLTVEVVKVTIDDPRQVTLLAGNTHDFTAHARTSPEASDTGVNWSVEGGGTVFPRTGPQTKYTAPTVVDPPTVTVTVTAKSAADPTRIALATVTVQRKVFISVSPRGAVTLSIFEDTPNDTAQQQFTALVTGTNDTAVRWSVETFGGASIDSSGLFTATRAGIFHVQATNIASQTSSEVVTVTVKLIPKSQTVDKGLARQPVSEHIGLGQTPAETVRPGDDPPKKRKGRKKTVGQGSEHAKDGSNDGRAFIRSEERPEVGTALLKNRG